MPDILSDISIDISSDISSDILVWHISDVSFDISSDISSGISSDISSDIPSDLSSDISSDIFFVIFSDIPSDISFDILSDISSDISSDILVCNISDISFDISFDISSDISPNCECPAWHWKTEDAVEPILDVWQRDHLSVHFKRTKATEASLFTCMMRVTATAFQQILQFSGTAGVFLEARTHDGRQQDPMFHTIWLNKMSYEEARAAQTTTEVPTALVRVTNRHGLRVASTAAKDVHEQFRPSDPFMTGTTQETWIVGPMPWGTTRQALQKLFTTWEWQAKPLQPAGRSADQLGLKWQVRAAAPPKSFVFTLSHGDVLIVKDSAPVATGVRVPEVEASQKTQQAVQPGPLAYDPWAKAAFWRNQIDHDISAGHNGSYRVTGSSSGGEGHGQVACEFQQARCI